MAYNRPAGKFLKCFLKCFVLGGSFAYPCLILWFSYTAFLLWLFSRGGWCYAVEKEPPHLHINTDFHNFWSFGKIFGQERKKPSSGTEKANSPMKTEHIKWWLNTWEKPEKLRQWVMAFCRGSLGSLTKTVNGNTWHCHMLPSPFVRVHLMTDEWMKLRHLSMNKPLK